jgi:hypothetical protein
MMEKEFFLSGDKLSIKVENTQYKINGERR